MLEEKRVVCQTPTPGKKPTRIHKWEYDLLRDIITEIAAGSPDGVEFKGLPNLVEARLSPEQLTNLGSVSWYTTCVKPDMEVRGDIARVPGAKPQRLRAAQ